MLNGTFERWLCGGIRNTGCMLPRSSKDSAAMMLNAHNLLLWPTGALSDWSRRRSLFQPILRSWKGVTMPTIKMFGFTWCTRKEIPGDKSHWCFSWFVRFAKEVLMNCFNQSTAWPHNVTSEWRSLVDVNADRII